MARIYKSFSTTSPNANKNGHLYDMDVVVDDINNLLATKKGEYPMQYNLGSIAHEYIHQPSLTDAEKSIIINDTIELLSNDPRLNNINVYIEELSNGYYIIINATVSPQDQEINLSVNLNDI
jgi:phage baseplate assembly protein W